MANKRRQAQKGRSKSRRNFVAIPFRSAITLGTLAAGVVLTADLTAAQFAREFYAISVDSSWALNGHTANEGPITVGFAHNDLSVGEIAEALDAELTDPSDIIAKERARRPVRRVGVFAGLAQEDVLNDGMEGRTPLRFGVNDGHAVAAYARNLDASTLTTGNVVRITGTLYGKWQ